MKIAIKLVIRYSLCLIFLYAGATKAMAPSSFYQDVRMYHLLSDEFAWGLAHYLPWLELMTSAGLLVAYCRGAAYLIILGLLLVFTGALFSVWWRGLNIECGCFGAKGDSSDLMWVLARDCLLLGTTFYVWRLEMWNGRFSPAAKPPSP